MRVYKPGDSCVLISKPKRIWVIEPCSQRHYQSLHKIYTFSRFMLDFKILACTPVLSEERNVAEWCANARRCAVWRY